MFTINIYLKFAIIALCLIGGIVLTFIYGLVYSWPFLLIAILLLASYFLLGTVQTTAQLVHDMKFLEAEKRLGLTYFPNLLFKPNRAAYFMIKGTMAAQMKNNELAEQHFLHAQSIGIQGDNEKAMVGLQLANLSASRNKWTNAINQYKEIKKLNISEPMLKEQMAQFEKVLKNRGVMKASNQGMRFQPGGKRRRPKMR
jgi:hypothetical protein